VNCLDCVNHPELFSLNALSDWVQISRDVSRLFHWIFTGSVGSRKSTVFNRKSAVRRVDVTALQKQDDLGTVIREEGRGGRGLPRCP